MIDLHCHILPGIDDGARTPAASVAMAQAAVSDGVRTIVATPHVNVRYDVDPDDLARRVGEVNILLAREQIPLAVLPGAELAVSRISGLSDDAIRKLSLGTSPSVLIESPYVKTVPFLDELLFDLQVRGFRPLLAHPERSPLFQSDIERLRGLVERGVTCSVNAGSLAGAFGSGPRRFSLRLIREGLVHSISSDAHDPSKRPPVLTPGFEAAVGKLPGLASQRGWFTRDAPSAILAGDPLPARPEPPAEPSRWAWLTGRR